LEKNYAETHEDLRVYQDAYKLAMEIFERSKRFPKEEIYSMTDQIRRSSRSVCTNIAEAWMKRRYAAAFAAKLTDSMSEAGETQSWLRFAVDCGYLAKSDSIRLFEGYSSVLNTLKAMAHHADKWCHEHRTPYDEFSYQPSK
jgi:four helix bundle protein